jgi:hypothetical protein
MTMNNHAQSLGAAFAMTLCLVLVAGSGFAQQAPNTGSDRDASRANGGGSAGKGAAGSNTNDPGGDRGNPNRPGVADAVHAGAPAHAGSGSDASRTGSGPASGPGTTPGNLDIGSNRDVEPIRLEGFSGLQRRANRKTLIANAPKMPGKLPAAVGITAPLTPPGANGGTTRNAVSVVIPGSPSSARHAPDFRAAAASGASGPGAAYTGAVGAGIAKSNTGATDWRHPNLPSNAVAGAMPHAAVINGTTISHIASGPGYLGGPAKDRSGINGTAIRPKR